jgi:outer membrane protein assembly factor BamE (lipoprotein component of BamABCDE complex)
MSYRTLLMSAVLAAGASLAGLAQADIVAVPDGIAVKESDGIAPARGMTMSQVASKFGAPVTKVPAVGNPPISRWEYPGFVVYFERDHVIHSVVSESAAPPESAAPAPPAAESAAPPAESAEPAAPPAATEPPPTP